MTKPVRAYEILDHGVEHPQYFSGCGTCLTEFTDVATGSGENYAEALDDALESLAQNDWDTAPVPTDPPHADCVSAEVGDGEETDLVYLVSVRVR